MEGGGGSTSISCLMGFGENINNNNNNNSDGGGFCPMIMMPPPVGSNGGVGSSSSTSMMLHHMNSSNTITSTGYYFMDQRNNTNTDHDDNNDDDDDCSLKAKIMAHPHYNRLLTAYLNCQKIGAPPEVVARLEELAAACSSSSSSSAMGGRHSSSSRSSCVGEDPALDQFMEAYCEMLIKYEQELSKPFKEAMLFLSRIDSHFKALNLQSPHHSSSSTAPPAGCGESMERNGNSSDDEVDVNNNLIDPQAEDRQLKGQLLRKYSGYLGSLKQEFMKKRKKGKLPKEARQQLLDWWSRHYKWPYPSESQKLALAESTGLDQKQINNWFINQRKRHWKPSEDMQFVVMDATHPGQYYMDNVLGNPFAMDISPTLL